MRAYQLLTTPRIAPQYSRNIQLVILMTCAFAFVLAIFFFAFVLCMCADQYEAVTTGVPGIDAFQYKGEIPKKYSMRDGIRRMIFRGEPFGWRWFIPLPVFVRIPSPPAPPLSEELQADSSKSKNSPSEMLRKSE